MQNHPITLHVLPGSQCCTSVLVAVELAKIPATIKVHSSTSLKSEEFMKISPLGEVPVLESNVGNLFGSGAILRYIADNSEVLKSESAKDSAEIDQWLEWMQLDFMTMVGNKHLTILGSSDTSIPQLNKKAFENEVKEWVKQIDMIDKHIKGKEYMVGKKVSIADVLLVSLLNYFFRFVFSEKEKKKLPNLHKYFERLVNAEGFKTVLRPYKEAKKEFPRYFTNRSGEEKNAKKAAKTDKKDDKEAQKKIDVSKIHKTTQKKPEDKPKEAQPVIDEKKKVPTYPPTKFDMHSFKTFFVNEPDNEKKMQYLWEQFDENAMSIWHLTYDKLSSECKKLFLTNNLMTGFVDRAAHMRKYVFGVHDVLGEPGNYNIKGVWMGYGVDELPLIRDHDQYDVYIYRKLDPKVEADKQLIIDYFTKKEEDVDIIEGETLRTFSYVL